MCKDDEFDISFIKDVNETSEFEAKAKEADLVLILSSLFHFNTHGQLMRFLQGVSIPMGKPITYITTSGCNMDVPAHNYLRSYARHNGLKWIQSLSFLDEDVLEAHRREELYRWFCYVKDIVQNRKLDSSSLNNLKVSIVDCGDKAEETEQTANLLRDRFAGLGASVKIINLREKNLVGCMACFACYTTNKCCLKDDFLEVDKEINSGDLIVTVSGTNYNQFSTRYKYYLDRHVMYGRYCQCLEKTKAYVVCGDIDPQDLSELELHTTVIDTLDSDHHVGIYHDTYESLENLVRDSALACIHDLFPQRNTFWYGLNLQFANLAYRLQRMTPNDYNYFKAQGYYDPPKIIDKVNPIQSVEDGKATCKMRLIQFEEMLAEVDGPPPLLTHRGERTQFNGMIGADTSKVHVVETKQKGFSFFKKKHQNQLDTCRG